MRLRPNWEWNFSAGPICEGSLQAASIIDAQGDQGGIVELCDELRKGRAAAPGQDRREDERLAPASTADEAKRKGNGEAEAETAPKGGRNRRGRRSYGRGSETCCQAAAARGKDAGVEIFETRAASVVSPSSRPRLHASPACSARIPEYEIIDPSGTISRSCRPTTSVIEDQRSLGLMRPSCGAWVSVTMKKILRAAGHERHRGRGQDEVRLFTASPSLAARSPIGVSTARLQSAKAEAGSNQR